mmetsp:Transcript_12859/g.17858  ORF Transcript_12859/g.17858 Transcript_12859/m.17858 type:complete len:97 (+) Transcript_12859:216-506(+)
MAATEVDKKTESIESNYQGNLSRFRAWRDTTDPAWVLGTIFLGTALVSRPAGTMPMIRNAVLSTGLVSWLIYPQLTGEGVIMAKQLMKSSIKTRLE